MRIHAFTGEAAPPPPSPPPPPAQPPTPCPRALCVAAFIILAFLCTPCLSTAQPASPPQKSTTQGKVKPQKTPAHADIWTFSTQKPRPVDQIWTRGMAPQALKQAAVVGLKNKALKNQLKAPNIPSVTPPAHNKNAASPLDAEPKRATDMPLGKNMRLRGDMESVNSSWHSSSFKNDIRIDQDSLRQETNIYGAYADIEAADDLTLSAGPEFSHTRTQNSTQHNNSDSGALGLGVQLKWGF